VKVYKLNSVGAWEDKGTGHISVEYMEVRTLTRSSSSQYYMLALVNILQKAHAMGLIVISEDESKTLLVHKIVPKEDYYLRSGKCSV
jgi:protein phosphatase-4 regulatory subunit 3